MANEKEDLESLLDRREAIDRALLEKHARELAILFTDMVGSTQYFESRGDIEGLSLVRRHNEILFPLVDGHQGRVIKTIGDAILAVFESPAQAARCAVRMQRALEEERNRPGAKPINIRIGIHLGRALVAEKDVYGDAVNTAARVVHESRNGEILVSAALARTLAGGDFNITPRGSFLPKGKAEAMAVLALRWREVAEPEAAPEAAVEPRAGRPETFHLALEGTPRGIRVAAVDGESERGAVRSYNEVSISPERLAEFGREVASFMDGDGAPSYRERVRESGEQLFRAALSELARQKLARTGLRFLTLSLDDSLVRVPWELMHDGREFFALRFALGRLVAARAEELPSAAGTSLAGPALVVSDATGGLRAAAGEGEAVAGLLRDGFRGEVRHVQGPVTRAAFLEQVPGCGLLHFAGHAEQPRDGRPGGLVFSDGLVTPAQLAATLGEKVPLLVFANSCYTSSGKGFLDSSGATSDLASKLLLRGVRHFLGPVWSVPDRDALEFALRFYERCLAGASFGESVRDARISLWRGERRSIAFASYALYGEPRGGLPAERVGLEAGALRSAPAEGQPEGREMPRRPAGRRWLLPLGLVVLLCTAAAVFLARRTSEGEGQGTATAPAQVPGSAPVVPNAKALPRQGPIRLCVLPFKNLGAEAELEFLREGLTEAIVTDFGSLPGVSLIERGQIDLDIKEIEFSQSKYVDPATRAALGKIAGAEVVVLGAFQKAQDVIRAHARLVDVESGQVLAALKLERPASKPF